MTIFAWLDYAYYDGLMTFAQGCHTGDGLVRWMGQELPPIEPSGAAGEGDT